VPPIAGASSVEQLVSSSGIPLAAHGTLNVAEEVVHAEDRADALVLPKKPRSRRSTAKASTRLVIRNREQVVAISNIIISSLQEALDYDPARHHNQPPPELRIEDARYLQDIRDLIAELRRLNTLLETSRPPQRGEPKRTIIDINKHINKFLENYIPMLAKGTAGLTVATMASLLFHAGVGEDIIMGILSMAKLGRH
jgi:hypothetical protein